MNGTEGRLGFLPKISHVLSECAMNRYVILVHRLKCILPPASKSQHYAMQAIDPPSCIILSSHSDRLSFIEGLCLAKICGLKNLPRAKKNGVPQLSEPCVIQADTGAILEGI